MLKRSTKSLFFLILLLSILIGGMYGPESVFNKPSPEMANEPIVNDYFKALKIIDDNYVEPPNNELLTQNAIGEMLHALDPHSNFFGSSEFSNMQDDQSSKFCGVGISIGIRSGRIYILDVMPGMPAEKAGLKYGDAILSVDGKASKGWSWADAQKCIRGEKDSEVKISIERAGITEPLNFNVIRDEVPYLSVRNSFILKPGIGYIALSDGFNKDTDYELREAITKLKVVGMTSLVLDLRDNPGGLLDQGIEIAKIFLPRDKRIVSVKGRDTRTPTTYISENSVPESMPLVVMINGESASASEIVAGALQDNDRAWIVGEDSFGKGLVQTQYSMRGGTGLVLTTGKYYTPSGRSIQRDYNGVGFYDYYYSRYNGDINSRGKQSLTSPGGFQLNPSHTSTGRLVLSGGGITPDTLVKTQPELVKLRDACFEFARIIVAGLIPEFSQYKVNTRAADYKFNGSEYLINDQAISAFRNFIKVHPELQITDSMISKEEDYISRRIRAEILTAAYGLAVADQFIKESDRQVVRAIEELPKARRLSDEARLFKNEK